jgi:hypothetical protein
MPSFLSGIPEQDGRAFVVDNFFEFWASYNHICAGAAVLRGSLVDEAGGQRTDLVISGDLEYWAYLATFGDWGFIPRVLLFVDGTQVGRGNLYKKFYDRYRRCSSIESWQARVLPRLKNSDLPGFVRVRGRLATWFIFAKVFIGEDDEAFSMARAYRRHLDGKFGSLWRVGLVSGRMSWKPLSMVVRTRTRLQYYLRDKMW